LYKIENLKFVLSFPISLLSSEEEDKDVEEQFDITEERLQELLKNFDVKINVLINYFN
jgi:hypothetical protein